MEHGAEIQRFSRTVLSGTPDEIGAARAALLRVAGPDRVAAVAAVTAWFDGINRVADATGLIPPQELVPDPAHGR